MKDALLKLGLDDRAIALHVSVLDRPLLNSVPRLWNVRHLRDQYRASRDMILRSTRRLRYLEQEAAVVECLLIGRHVVRQIMLDPLLPEEMVGNRDRGDLITEMMAYDAFGKDLWRNYLN